MRIYLYAALFGKVDVSNVGWALAHAGIYFSVIAGQRQKTADRISI